MYTYIYIYKLNLRETQTEVWKTWGSGKHNIHDFVLGAQGATGWRTRNVSGPWSSSKRAYPSVPLGRPWAGGQGHVGGPPLGQGAAPIFSSPPPAFK